MLNPSILFNIEGDSYLDASPPGRPEKICTGLICQKTSRLSDKPTKSINMGFSDQSPEIGGKRS